MKQQSKAHLQFDTLTYPPLNIYFSPRVYQQKINHRSIPMCKYIQAIQATNISKIYDQKDIQPALLQQLSLQDGLIYQFSQMNKPSAVNGNKVLKIKVLICVCMYNQSKNAINLTLKGIYKNLENLRNIGISPEQVAVILMQDGILKLVSNRNKRQYAKDQDSMIYFFKELDKISGKSRCYLEQRINVILDQIDNYNRKGMGSFVANNKDFPPSIQKNISLLYQNLWRPSYTIEKEELKKQKQKIEQKYDLKLFSCFKHLNGTKLSSHLWFFQGFCRFLDPQFIILLDVGTVPQADGVSNLIQGFKDDLNIGGVTGLMSVDANFPSQQGGQKDSQEQTNCFTEKIKDGFFSIQKAQQYQYIIAHFLDKNAQGALGFLHVLPGAWSAYRYRALIKSDQYQPNLLQHSYFKMILNPQMSYKDFKQANMYLAEDRILSLGIYCQSQSQYYLKYIPNAVAKTDPMKTHEDLMKQRRRWINSSLFAFLYVWKNYYFNSMQSKHSGFDKYFKLNLSMLLALLSFVTSYLTPSMYFYILFATIYQIDPQSQICQILSKLVSILYILTYLIGVAGGLAGSVWTKHAHVLSFILSGFTFVMLGLVIYNIVYVYLGFKSTGIDWTSFSQVSILVMVGINLGFYTFVIIMHIPSHANFVWRLIIDHISYLMYQGAYAQTMVSYALCNVDDCSWGTKGSTDQHGKKQESQKVFFVSSWLFYNCLMAYLFIYIDIVVPQTSTGPKENRKLILILIAIYGTSQMFVKSVLAILHHLKWLFNCKCKKQEMFIGRVQQVQKYWRQSNSQYIRLTNQ